MLCNKVRRKKWMNWLEKREVKLDGRSKKNCIKSVKFQRKGLSQKVCQLKNCQKTLEIKSTNNKMHIHIR